MPSYKEKYEISSAPLTVYWNKEQEQLAVF